MITEPAGIVGGAGPAAAVGLLPGAAAEVGELGGLGVLEDLGVLGGLGPLPGLGEVPGLDLTTGAAATSVALRRSADRKLEIRTILYSRESLRVYDHF